MSPFLSVGVRRGHTEVYPGSNRRFSPLTDLRTQELNLGFQTTYLLFSFRPDLLNSRTHHLTVKIINF